MWFPDHSYADYEFKLLNAGLCDKGLRDDQGLPAPDDRAGDDRNEG